MSDTSTIWIRDLSSGDWSLSGSTLQTGGDLQTAVLISLFSDREANPDDVISDGTNDPRGWIGDFDQPYKIGSRIWLLMRAKQTQETLSRANDYIGEALQWLIDDSVVYRFDITTEWTRPGMLGAKVIAYRGSSTTSLNFSWVRSPDLPASAVVPRHLPAIGVDYVIGSSIIL